QLLHIFEGAKSIDNGVEIGELVVLCCIIVNDLGVHEPQLDVAEAAILEGLIGLFDCQRQEIFWFADVKLGHVPAVEQHDINGDGFGLQGEALGVGKWRNRWFGSRGSGRRWWRGGWNTVDAAGWIGMVRWDLAAIHLRERLDPATKAFDREDRAVVDKVS